MDLIVGPTALGTPEATWLGPPLLWHLPALRLSHPPGRVAVVAPHPDDEVLGAGGLLQQLADQDVAVEILAVTDGEAAPCPPSDTPAERGQVRRTESALALQRLGLVQTRMTRLGVADGAVSDAMPQLIDALTKRLDPDVICLAPWKEEGHPDHDAAGAAAEAACRLTGSTLLHYLVWTWHWADPDSSAVPWPRARRIPLSSRHRAPKRWAIAAFRSQRTVLPAAILPRFWRPFEVVLA